MSANMFSQRAVQLSMRRLAASNPSTFIMTTSSLGRRSAPTAIAMGRHMQLRYAATKALSNDDGHAILVEQRRHRPVSPHLTIYKPQVTWILSSLTRITGVALSGTFYVFGAAYLAAPLLGWHMESASIAAAFAAWPIVLKVLAKSVLAFPFAFHSLQGLRHFVWDAGKTITNKQVIVTGWSVVGLTVASTLGLVFFL